MELSISVEKMRLSLSVDPNVSKTVDRTSEKPVWLPAATSMRHAKPDQPKANHEGSIQRVRRSTSECRWSDFGDKSPLTTEMRIEFQNCNKHGKRRLARRRDQIQFAPSMCRSQSRSNYMAEFRASEKPVKVKPYLPVDQGINGLESRSQLEKRSIHSTSCNESIPTRIQDPYPSASVYRSDYQKTLDLMNDSCCTREQVFEARKNSKKPATDYSENYHTWVNISRCTGDWIPEKAIYVPGDQRQKMESGTVYNEQFRGDQTERAIAKRLPTTIDKYKLLNAVNGESQPLPVSLYTATYQPQRGIHNWSERQIHQNLKALSKQVGPSHEDDTYWLGVDTDPFCDYRKAIFSKAS